MSPQLSTARPSTAQRNGANSHDQPTTSPSWSVWICIAPRPGASTSSATRPRRIRKKCSAGSPSRINRAPAATCSLRPQPAISSRCAGSNPANVGVAASNSSIIRIGSLLAISNRARLLGEVDPHRAPGDASPAADTPRRTELVPPAGQLVSHPLAVAGSRRVADRAAVNVRVVDREAGIPALVTFDVLALEIGDVLHRRAEARRADHRAVAAGQAALGDLVPTRVLEVAVQQPLDIRRVELATHLRGGPCMHHLRRITINVHGRAMRHLLDHVGSALGPDLNHEVVHRPVEDLGERQIKAALGYRSGVHRDAEARPACLSALHGDDEHVLGPRAVGVGMHAAEQHSVEHSDRVQLTRPRPEERKAEGFTWWLGYLAQPTVLVDPRPPELYVRRQLVLLPGVRTDGVAEQRLVVPSPQAVMAAVLLVGPADREIPSGADLVVDDRPIADRGTDDRVTPTSKRPQQRVEIIPLDDMHASHSARTPPPTRGRPRRTAGRCGSRPTPAPRRPWLDNADPRSQPRTHAYCCPEDPGRRGRHASA